MGACPKNHGPEMARPHAPLPRPNFTRDQHFWRASGCIVGVNISGKSAPKVGGKRVPKPGVKSTL